MRVGAASFEECFHEHYSSLVAYGTSLTGDPDAARDITQEAFARLHTHWERVRCYDAPGAWLRRVVANLVIDRHRAQNSERRAVDRLRRTRPQEPTAAYSDPWSRLVKDLPPRQRAIVTLHYGEDMAVAEIAEVLDININTVKSAAKARETLRTRWEGGSA